MPFVEKDQHVNAHIVALAKVPEQCRIAAGRVLEGGSIHCDGEGTCITTAECLLHHNRLMAGETRSRGDMEAFLKRHLGVTSVIWLPLGVDGDNDTDGHCDNIAAFVAPGKVVLTWPEDASHPQRKSSEQALQELSTSLDARGRVLEVIKIPHPTGPQMVISPDDVQGLTLGGNNRCVGEVMAGSYVNFVIVNGGVVMPQFGCPEDEAALAVLKDCFPDREVVPVDSRDILLGGGNIHCITQQEPRVM